jgi:type II secretory pathway pseudopilin PulG
MPLDAAHEAAVSRDQGSGIGEQGFTLVELLIALGITLAIGGAIAALAPPARMAFERVPAELELQQRGRAALEMLTNAVRAAGQDVAAAYSLGTMADMFPAITLGDPDESGTLFGSLRAIVPVANAAQGLLESDQASATGPMTLAISPCPNVKDVCGFTPGAAAVVVDAAGHFEVFVISATSPGARRLTPDRALSRAYAAGSVVVEIEESTFRLDQQADGSFSLIRETAAGAVQPIVDFLSSLAFTFAHHQLEIALTAGPPIGGLQDAVADRQFRTSIRLRNAP